MPAVKSEYGPTLPQMLATRSLGLRVAAAAVALVVCAGAVMIALTTRDDETAVLVREPVAFNFAYGSQWTRADRPGTLVALRHARGPLFLDSYVIRDLRLPRYEGSVGGTLPVYADGYMRRLRERYPKFELVGEGRTRINNAIGYDLTFRAFTSTGRRLYGRHLLLVQDDPDGLRRGVVLELESTPSAGTPNATETGAHGALKTPLRSFRFGSERKGGTA